MHPSVIDLVIVLLSKSRYQEAKIKAQDSTPNKKSNLRGTHVSLMKHLRYVNYDTITSSTIQESTNILGLPKSNSQSQQRAAGINNRHSSSDWLHNLRTLHKSSVLREIKNPVLSLSAWATLISLVQKWFLWSGKHKAASMMCVSSSAHSFLVSSIGLLLVFRTNSAYQRFYVSEMYLFRYQEAYCSLIFLILRSTIGGKKDLGTDSHNLQKLISDVYLVSSGSWIREARKDEELACRFSILAETSCSIRMSMPEEASGRSVQTDPSRSNGADCGLSIRGRQVIWRSLSTRKSTRAPKLLRGSSRSTLVSTG